jgi:HSP20 family molecular chaperone IbpA
MHNTDITGFTIYSTLQPVPTGNPVTGIKPGTFFSSDHGRTKMAPAKKQRKDEKNIIVPPTGISESGRLICIISQIHGIPEEEIRIDLEKTQLVISTSNEKTAIIQTVTVPEGSRISKKKFRDGILEIILERPL